MDLWEQAEAGQPRLQSWSCPRLHRSSTRSNLLHVYIQGLCTHSLQLPTGRYCWSCSSLSMLLPLGELSGSSPPPSLLSSNCCYIISLTQDPSSISSLERRTDGSASSELAQLLQLICTQNKTQILHVRNVIFSIKSPLLYRVR